MQSLQAQRAAAATDEGVPVRPGLLAVGVILLVLGAIGYFLMQPVPDADSTTTQLSVLAMILGAILTLLGLFLPDEHSTAPVVKERRVIKESDDEE